MLFSDTEMSYPITRILKEKETQLKSLLKSSGKKQFKGCHVAFSDKTEDKGMPEVPDKPLGCFRTGPHVEGHFISKLLATCVLCCAKMDCY